MTIAASGGTLSMKRTTFTVQALSEEKQRIGKDNAESTKAAAMIMSNLAQIGTNLKYTDGCAPLCSLYGKDNAFQAVLYDIDTTGLIHITRIVIGATTGAGGGADIYNVMQTEITKDGKISSSNQLGGITSVAIIAP